MNNNFQFDLNNAEQYPLLNGLDKNIDRLTPQGIKHLYFRETKFENEDEEIRVFKNEMQGIKSDFYNRFDYDVRQLKNERDNCLGTAIPTNEQRGYAFSAYNSIIIEKVNSFHRQINHMIITIFPTFVLFGNMEDMNLDKYFEIWYKEFPIKDDAGNNPPPEPMPDFEYKTHTKKIAWLHEIGILETVMDKCKDGETINSRRAANVIHSFTGIPLDSLRQSLRAIYQPGNDQKNNPLINPENKLFVAEMAAKFKLNKKNKL